MSMTDPVADLLTRIRNVNVLGRKSVKAPFSRIKEQILSTLKREGFIDLGGVSGLVGWLADFLIDGTGLLINGLKKC